MRRFFAGLNEEDFPYLVLRNYQGYPKKLRKLDIGLLIDHRCGKRLVRVFQSVCDAQGFGCLIRGRFKNGVVIEAIRYELDDDGEVVRRVLKVDARAYKSFRLTGAHRAVKGLTYKVFFGEVKRRLRSQDGCEFYTYDQPDELVMLFRQWKRKQDERYRDQIVECLSDEEIKHWFCDASGVDKNEIGAVFSGGYEERHDRIVWKLLAKRWGRSTLWRTAKTHLCAGLARLRNVRLTLGPIVYVSGPDGAGKTTLLNHVQGQLDELNIKYKYMYSLKKFLRFITRRLVWLKYWKQSGDKSKKGFETHFQAAEHRDRNTGSSWWYVRKYLALLVGVFDIMMGGCWAMAYRLTGRLVLVETSPYDVFIKYHMPEFVRTEKILAGIVPKPTVGFMLQANADDIHARKAELTVKEINEFYERLGVTLGRAKAMSRFVDIDTQTSPQMSAAQISNELFKAVGVDLIGRVSK